MDIDVGMWLTLALFVTVIIWLADKALKLRQRKGMIGNTVETSNSLISGAVHRAGDPLFYCRAVHHSLRFHVADPQSS